MFRPDRRRHKSKDRQEMTYILLILIAVILILIYLQMRRFLVVREAELQKMKVIHTPLYPAFSEAEIEHWHPNRELEKRKSERLSKELECTEELEKKKPFTPTNELKLLVRRVNEADMDYELDYNMYRFLIEANLAVFHRRKTISEVREE